MFHKYAVLRHVLNDVNVLALLFGHRWTHFKGLTTVLSSAVVYNQFLTISFVVQGCYSMFRLLIELLPSASRMF